LLLNDLVAMTLSGMGYELVALERTGYKLVRVYIDHPAVEDAAGDISSERAITVEDCEAVTHQLLHVFTVENVDYERLEVSSPGLDRPLCKVADFARFAGCEADVRFRMPVPGTAQRKKFTGVIQPPEGEKLRLEIETAEGKAVLDFILADIDKARLVPQVDFRSRKG